MPYITSVEQLAKEEGVAEERKQVIEHLLQMRFGELDETLRTTVEPLLSLPAQEYTCLLMEFSRKELISQFGAGISN